MHGAIILIFRILSTAINTVKKISKNRFLAPGVTAEGQPAHPLVNHHHSSEWLQIKEKDAEVLSQQFIEELKRKVEAAQLQSDKNEQIPYSTYGVSSVMIVMLSRLTCQILTIICISPSIGQVKNASSDDMTSPSLRLARSDQAQAEFPHHFCKHRCHTCRNDGSQASFQFFATLL